MKAGYNCGFIETLIANIFTNDWEDDTYYIQFLNKKNEVVALDT